MVVLNRLQRAWSWYQSELARRPLRTQVVTSAALWATGDAVAQRVDLVARENRRRRQRENEGAALAAEEQPLAPVAGRAHYEVNEPSAPVKEAAQGGAHGHGHGHGDSRLQASSAGHRYPDFMRICTTGLFGAAFVGPVGHYWYAWLEHFVKATLRLRPKTTPFIATKIALDTFFFGPVHLVAFFTWTGLVSGHPMQQIKRDVTRDFLPAFLTEATVWPMIQFGNFRYVPVRHQLLFVNIFCLLDSAWLSWLKYEQDAQWKRTLSKVLSWPSK